MTESSQRQYIRTESEGGVLTITVDHGRMNTLDPQTLAELESAVDEFLAGEAHKAAVIASANPAVFVSGADLAAFAEPAAAEMINEHIRKGQRLFHKIHQSPKPFIAAVNGLALGGGFELALACHLRVAAERARLGFPEVSLGIMPGWGGTQLLTRLVGSAKAAEIILIGETLSAQEALQLNLVNRVAPRSEVLPLAKELAGKIAAQSALAVQSALKAVLAAPEMRLEDGLAFEASLLEALLATAEARASIRAHLERGRGRF
jgi:enoyl-CoA hydratase